MADVMMDVNEPGVTYRSDASTTSPASLVWISFSSYDVPSLDLTREQEGLLEAIVQTGKQMIVVLINGRPFSVRWIAEHVPAIEGENSRSGLSGTKS